VQHYVNRLYIFYFYVRNWKYKKSGIFEHKPCNEKKVYKAIK